MCSNKEEAPLFYCCHNYRHSTLRMMDCNAVTKRAKRVHHFLPAFMLKGTPTQSFFFGLVHTQYTVELY